ncbi:PHO85 cyclin-1 [Tieghemiomyces parasiticus]|uniref:PHO85 cyclin-1 n=1 Tax=Tieghemiomyces parasiticus TaxID=78921 RepID=A0A9W8DYL6_9FUNG|nr:PHO85 cyclin-1 [Tieghemiomyces parasiticus]
MAMECTNHRIFLASLILAGKYLNDASPKNKYWARFSERFSLAEVNLMEQQLMQLLQFQFEITEAQLLAQLSSFAHLITPPASPVTYTIRPRGVVGGNHDHLPPPSAVVMHPRRGSGGTSSLVSITPSRTPSSTLLTAESMSSTIAPSPLELNCTSLAHPAPIHHQYHSSAPAVAVQTQPQPPHYQFTHVAQPGTAAVAEAQPSAAAQRGGPHPPSYYQTHPPPVALPHFSAVFNHPPSVSQPELLTHPAQHIYHHSSAPAHHQYHHHTQQQRSIPYPAPSAAHLMPMHVPHNHHRQQHHPVSASAAAMHPTPHCSTSDAAAAFYLYHQWTSAGAAPGSVTAVVSNLSARTQQPPPPHMSYAPTAYSNTEAAGNLTYRPSACIVYQN